jgi:hypothetical protein
MGLKYHLGHTGYVTREKAGDLFVTKSSIKLNKLGDLAHAADNIEFKLKAIKEETMTSGKSANANGWLK